MNHPTPGMAHNSVGPSRHAVRRMMGIPTVSVFVGPVTAACREARSALNATVVFAQSTAFPWESWLSEVWIQSDWPTQAVTSLASRAGCDPNVLQWEWQHKTLADREHFWKRLAPHPNDPIVRMLADRQFESLSKEGETVAGTLFNLEIRKDDWPGIFFTATSMEDFASLAETITTIAVRLPRLPLMIAVSADLWANYLDQAPESRAKTILREGEWRIPIPNEAEIAQTLLDAGLSHPETFAQQMAAHDADSRLVEAAAVVVRATTPPPESEADNDRARSAAERFLFDFLEMIPETSGRFSLNEKLDFDFGNRPAEVDLLCRDPKIALEIDGYFHFLEPTAYRRDRLKDYELQRRGFLVLRFLAEDVIPQMELIRDRILDALTDPAPGDSP